MQPVHVRCVLIHVRMQPVRATCSCTLCTDACKNATCLCTLCTDILNAYLFFNNNYYWYTSNQEIQLCTCRYLINITCTHTMYV